MRQFVEHIFPRPQYRADGVRHTLKAMFGDIRAFAKLYTIEEMEARSANGLASNSPIDSNDSPPMNNQQVFLACFVPVFCFLA